MDTIHDLRPTGFIIPVVNTKYEDKTFQKFFPKLINVKKKLLKQSFFFGSLIIEDYN
jgi:hypothetical protein